jgi:hypothetical protein
MKTKIMFLAFLACIISTPAMADLFHFSVHRLEMTFDGTRFDASLDKPLGDVTLTRDVAPLETVKLEDNTLGDFTLWMDLDNITSASASAIGKFTITDIDGDTITGDISGNWMLLGGSPYFYGDLSNVWWTTDDKSFDGDDGSGDNSVALDFGGQPWLGTLIELTTGATPWFSNAWSDPDTYTGGSVDAWVVIPTPTAVILGILSAWV